MELLDSSIEKKKRHACLYMGLAVIYRPNQCWIRGFGHFSVYRAKMAAQNEAFPPVAIDFVDTALSCGNYNICENP
jgi:hypothetical protein